MNGIIQEETVCYKGLFIYFESMYVDAQNSSLSIFTKIFLTPLRNVVNKYHQKSITTQKWINLLISRLTTRLIINRVDDEDQNMLILTSFTPYETSQNTNNIVS